ncbi:MAG: hypothetical protein ABEJ00_02300, partial [Gemmatimonadota bacterium]
MSLNTVLPVLAERHRVREAVDVDEMILLAGVLEPDGGPAGGRLRRRLELEVLRRDLEDRGSGGSLFRLRGLVSRLATPAGEDRGSESDTGDTNDRLTTGHANSR